MKKILVALDATAADGPVIAHARSIAKAFGAQLRLVHVAAPHPDFVGFEAGPQYIRDARAEELKHEHAELLRWRDVLQAEGLEVDMHLVMGPTVETLTAEAEKYQADLIVLGSHGRHGLARLFADSVSEEVLKEHRWPLYIIPTPSEA
ncbi:MAG: universal stress protein [Flavobacteriales bacterium]|nr:universal stress protein [Flavobacteriales bacterium]